MIPGLGMPYAMVWPKRKKKKKHLQQVKAQQLLVVATEMFAICDVESGS